MVAQVAGYRSFSSQKSGQWIVYSCLLPYSDDEVRQGQCVGMKVETYWTQHFFPVEVGQKVDLYFEPDFRGQARLANIIPRKEEKE